MPFSQFFSPTYSPSLVSIRLFTGIVSMLLSVWAFALDDLINSDGVLYMNMVRALLDGGFVAMSELYNWPFFSILVAGIYLLTGLPLETSGNILNTLMFVIFTDALVLICYKVLPNKRQVLIGSLFILGFTLLNDYRAYLFRDLGYWAFMALSLYLFIRFLEQPGWRNALSWQVSMVIAILFRVEGVVIMAALPLLLFKNSPTIRQAFQHIAMLWSVGGTMLIIAIITVLGFTGIGPAFSKLAELFAYIDLTSIFKAFEEQSNIINTDIMSVFDKKSGSLILSTGLLAMIIHQVIVAIGIAYLLFYLVSYKSQYAPHKLTKIPYQDLLIYFVAINFLILTVFVFRQYFLSTRYAVMLVTVIFLLMLPRFCQFVENLIEHRKRGLMAFTAFIIIAGPIDTLTSSVSKAYIKEVALWAAAELPDDSQILTLDTITDYYVRENNDKTNIDLAVGADPLSTRGYDYLIVTIRHNNHHLAAALTANGFETVFEASNSRGDLARVLKVPNNINVTE